MALPQTPLGELTALPNPLAGFQMGPTSKGGEARGGGGNGGEGRGRCARSVCLLVLTILATGPLFRPVGYRGGLSYERTLYKLFIMSSLYDDGVTVKLIVCATACTIVSQYPHDTVTSN